jgi:hypothetical protein
MIYLRKFNENNNDLLESNKFFKNNLDDSNDSTFEI